MNRTTAITLGVLIALAAIFLGAYALLNQKPVGNVTNGPAGNVLPEEENLATCSTADPDVLRIVNEPFDEVSDTRAAGTAEVEGVAVVRQEPAWGEAVMGVYLAVERANPEAFIALNRDRVSRDNTVNLIEDRVLLYRLGVQTGAGDFESSASVSDAARDAIERSVATGTLVSLVLQVPLYEGAGAPADFTFACAITLPEYYKG